MKYLNVISLVILCFSTPAALAGFSVRNSVEIDPQYRHLNQHGYTNDNEIYDVFGLLASHVEYANAPWFAEVKPEVRFVGSRGVMDDGPTNVSVRTTSRLFNSRRTLVHNQDAEAYFDFDRVNVKYSFDGGDVYIGRKPLSLGVLRLFPVWNKLTLPLIFQPGPEWIENPDVVGASFADGKLSYRAFASRGNRAVTDDLALVEARYAGDGFELQALGGTWWEHAALGVAGSVDAWESSLRFETLWLGRYRSEKAQGQFGLGFERALSSTWTLVAEALYQTAGVAEAPPLRPNVPLVPNRFMALPGKFYLLPNVAYQIHPLWTLRFGMLASPAAHSSLVALGGFDHSLTDDTTLTLKVKLPFGPDGSEFGSDRLVDPLGRSLGMSSTALLQVQSTF